MRHRPPNPGAGRGAAAVLLTALAVVLLAACGSSAPSGGALASKTPDQIVAAARAAAQDAATVHVSGSMLSGGKPISLDMELVAGKGGKGQIVVDGLRVALIAAERAVYVNGNSALYTRIAGPSAARVLQGRWLKVPPKSPSFAPLNSVASIDGLVGTTLAATGASCPPRPRMVAGVPAVGVSDPTKGGTLYVAATGVPYPLEIVKPAGGPADRVRPLESAGHAEGPARSHQHRTAERALVTPLDDMSSHLASTQPVGQMRRCGCLKA